MTSRGWIELALASPVCLWAGWPFLVRAVQSVRTRHLNMFTLIGLGVSVAYVYSVVAVLVPQVFPAIVPPDGRRRAGVFRSGRGHRDLDSARPGARAPREAAHQHGVETVVGIGARDRAPRDGLAASKRMCRSPRWSGAIGFASVPATRCRSMAWWSRARAPSTSPW